MRPFVNRHYIKEFGLVSYAWSVFLLAFQSAINLWIVYPGLRKGFKNGCNPKILLYGNISMYNHRLVAFQRGVAIIAVIGIPTFTVVTTNCLIYGFRLVTTNLSGTSTNHTPPQGLTVQHNNQSPGQFSNEISSAALGSSPNGLPFAVFYLIVVCVMAYTDRRKDNNYEQTRFRGI